ncbi:hypothetical protein V8F20_001565 [Naviculisporaceae sp. PSN 640]
MGLGGSAGCYAKFRIHGSVWWPGVEVIRSYTYIWLFLYSALFFLIYFFSSSFVHFFFSASYHFFLPFLLRSYHLLLLALFPSAPKRASRFLIHSISLHFSPRDIITITRHREGIFRWPWSSIKFNVCYSACS